MRPARAIVLGVVACVVAVGIALFCGQPFVWSRAISDASSIDRAVLGVRLPRVALGVIAGAGLASTGASYQALLRNPLAEPYVLGVAGGAALGATLALSLGAGALVSSIGVGVTALAATIGGALATAAAWAVASRRSTSKQDGKQGGFAHGDATSILLAGVVVNAIAAAAITFLKTLVRSEVAQSLLYWLAGFVDVPSTGALVAVGAAVAIGATILVADAARLNLLALGDEQAAHLGVDVRALERRVFAASSLVVGAIVATCGMIGFVGLLVPHVLRRSLLRGGSDYRVLVPASLFVGGAVLVLCDGAARMIYRGFGTEPPVGAITALVGGPVFLALLSRRAR
jgi:iron complex transport system permease protein